MGPTKSEADIVLDEMRQQWTEKGDSVIAELEKEALAKKSLWNRIREKWLYGVAFIVILVVMWIARDLLILDVHHTAISGRVMDLNGQPIGGAKVYIENSELQTTTSYYGRYSLGRIPPGKHWLIIEVPQQSGVAIPITMEKQLQRTIGDVKLHCSTKSQP